MRPLEITEPLRGEMCSRCEKVVKKIIWICKAEDFSICLDCAAEIAKIIDKNGN